MCNGVTTTPITPIINNHERKYMTKDKRSNKWTFLFYKESCPTDYLEVLEELHIPFILSPWHDKDIKIVSRATLFVEQECLLA